MTDNNFNTHKIGLNPYWWTGIIVSDESWKGNQESKRWDSIDKLPGWGARYKVRIVGKHTQDKNKLSDDKLELCEVMYPVTAGTGHAASYQTSNLRKGSVVFGIYKDGIDSNEPLIIGCIGNNDQTYLNSKQKNGFDSLRGFDLSIPQYSIPLNPSGGPKSSDGKSSPAIESNTPNTTHEKEIAEHKKSESQRQKSSIPTTSNCEPIDPTGVALTIRNLIQDVEKAKKEINDWRYKLTNELISENGQKFGLDEYIRYKVQNAAQSIVGWFKNLVFEIKRRINGNIERGAKDLYYLLFPNARPKAKAAIETAGDLINCLFRKIIGQLISILTKFLLDAVDRFINVPLCAAENILASVIGKLTGLISSALDAIMAPVNALLGAVDLVGDVLQIVKDILTFLSCDDPPNCSKTKEWSIYDGPSGGLNLDINSFFNKVKTFASNVAQSVNPDNFDFDFDFSDVFDNPCNINAVFCGPPTVEFFGGGGSGASGNAIISSLGEIMGVDVTSSGSNYTSSPLVRFVDACGKGRGAVGRAVLGKVSIPQSGDSSGALNGTQEIIETTGVIAVIMDDSGSGYIPNLDGDLGGDGRVWATKDETTVKREDGTYDRPYVPGENIDVYVGDFIRIPDNTTTQTDNQIIVGGDYVLVTNSGTITAPTRDTSLTSIQTLAGSNVDLNYPELDSGKYPVILYLCGLEIVDSGFNYSESDRIVIEPSYGATAIPTFGAFGALEGIKVTSGGEGFKEVPNIYIESETGFNAKILPRFCIDRVSADQLKEPGIQDKIVSVVDCVGKIPQVEFFRVPQ